MERKTYNANRGRIALIALMCAGWTSWGALITPQSLGPNRLGVITSFAYVHSNNDPRIPFTPLQRAALNRLMKFYEVEEPSARTIPKMFLHFNTEEVRKRIGEHMWTPKNFIKDYVVPSVEEIVFKIKPSTFGVVDILDIYIYLQPHEDVSSSLELCLQHKSPIVFCQASTYLSYGALVYGRKWPVDKVMNRILKYINAKEDFPDILIDLLMTIHDYGKHQDRLVAALEGYLARNPDVDQRAEQVGSPRTIKNLIIQIRTKQLPRKYRVLPPKRRTNRALLPGPHQPKPAWLKLKPVKGLLPGENPVVILRVPPKAKPSAVTAVQPRRFPASPRLPLPQPGFYRLPPGWHQATNRPVAIPNTGVFPKRPYRSNYGPSQVPKRK